MNLKKIIRKIHLWLGFATGLVVFIVAITGCIYVFSYDLKDFLYKNRYEIKIPKNGKRLAITELQNKAMELLPPDITYARIFIPRSSTEAVQFIFEKTDDEAWTYNKYKAFYKTVYMNPYSAEILYLENSKWEFFNVVMWTHMCLLLGYEPGNFIVKWSVYIFIIMMISGLYLWWPRNKTKKQYFQFQWNPKTRWKRKNFDLHRIIGFYVIPFALILAFTGLFWASSGFKDVSKWVANGGKTVEDAFYPISDTTQLTTNNLLDKITNTTITLFPETEYVLIKSPRNTLAPIIIRANSSTLELERKEFYFDQYSGELLHQASFQDKNNGDKLAAMNYDIHIGQIGGLPTKIFAFIISLLIASLPISGFLIWRGRNKK